MSRLTTDTPNGNTENALNLFYIKDMETWVRGGGDAPNHPDVRLVEYIRDIARKHSLNISLDTSDEDLCDELFEILLDGTDTIEGIVATLNTAAWAFAELREKLKEYEDTGLTPKECAAFAKFQADYDSAKDDIDIARIIEILSADAEGRLLVQPCEEAEAALRRLNDGD